MTLMTLYAELSLRMLLKPDDDLDFEPAQLGGVQWDVLLELARKNVILVHTYKRLLHMGVPISEAFSDAVTQESERIQCTVQVINRISEMCSKNGIQFVFTKAFQHYPDMGHDIDLFVSDTSDNIDKLITGSLSTSLEKPSLVNRIAGKTSYKIHGCPSPLEIHHGRMGHLGEHNIYPGMLMSNRRKVAIGGITTYVPSSEDQLVVQAMQRIYGHLCIRLSDVIGTSMIVREEGLDWDYVSRAARKAGIFDGLRCYLGYIDQIHVSLFEKSLLAPEIGKELAPEAQGKVQFRNGYYRFSTIPVACRVYSRKFFAEVGSQNWESVVKLCLLPAIAGLVGVRGLARR